MADPDNQSAVLGQDEAADENQVNTSAPTPSNKIEIGKPFSAGGKDDNKIEYIQVDGGAKLSSGWKIKEGSTVYVKGNGLGIFDKINFWTQDAPESTDKIERSGTNDTWLQFEVPKFKQVIKDRARLELQFIDKNHPNNDRSLVSKFTFVVEEKQDNQQNAQQKAAEEAQRSSGPGGAPSTAIRDSFINPTMQGIASAAAAGFKGKAAVAANSSKVVSAPPSGTASKKVSVETGDAGPDPEMSVETEVSAEGGAPSATAGSSAEQVMGGGGSAEAEVSQSATISQSVESGGQAVSNTKISAEQNVQANASLRQSANISSQASLDEDSQVTAKGTAGAEVEGSGSGEATAEGATKIKSKVQDKVKGQVQAGSQQDVQNSSASSGGGTAGSHRGDQGQGPVPSQPDSQPQTSVPGPSEDGSATQAGQGGKAPEPQSTAPPSTPSSAGQKPTPQPEGIDGPAAPLGTPPQPAAPGAKAPDKPKTPGLGGGPAPVGDGSNIPADLAIKLDSLRKNTAALDRGLGKAPGAALKRGSDMGPVKGGAAGGIPNTVDGLNKQGSSEEEGTGGDNEKKISQNKGDGPASQGQKDKPSEDSVDGKGGQDKNQDEDSPENEDQNDQSDDQAEPAATDTPLVPPDQTPLNLPGGAKVRGRGISNIAKSAGLQKAAGTVSGKIWTYGFGISGAVLFTGLDFFLGALIMDYYWFALHRNQPNLFPLKRWQKIMTIAAHILPFLWISAFVLLVLLVGCNYPVSGDKPGVGYRGSTLGLIIGDSCKSFDISQKLNNPSSPGSTSTPATTVTGTTVPASLVRPRGN